MTERKQPAPLATPRGCHFHAFSLFTSIFRRPQQVKSSPEERKYLKRKSTRESRLFVGRLHLTPDFFHHTRGNAHQSYSESHRWWHSDTAVWGHLCSRQKSQIDTVGVAIACCPGSKPVLRLNTIILRRGRTVERVPFVPALPCSFVARCSFLAERRSMHTSTPFSFF